MLNFDDIFFIKSIGNFNTYAAVFTVIVLFLIFIGWSKPATRSATLFISPFLILIAVGIIFSKNASRNVYVALENPVFSIEDSINVKNGSVENINGKYYFKCKLNPNYYFTSEAVYKDVQENYDIYLKKNKRGKSKEKYQENIQKWEKRGKNINGIKKG